jgi:hypothetical protein
MKKRKIGDWILGFVSVFHSHSTTELHSLFKLDLKDVDIFAAYWFFWAHKRPTLNNFSDAHSFSRSIDWLCMIVPAYKIVAKRPVGSRCADSERTENSCSFGSSSKNRPTDDYQVSWPEQAGRRLHISSFCLHIWASNTPIFNVIFFVSGWT